MKHIWLIACAIAFLYMAHSCFAANYYIDPANGNDNTNSGSFAAPWKSFRNITTYYNSSYRPSGWVDVQPGDSIILRAGTHNTMVNPGADGGPTSGRNSVAYFRNKTGSSSSWFHILAYPGETVVMDANSQGDGIYIMGGGYWEISGFTIQHAYTSEGGGITDGGNTGMKIHDMRIIDNGGISNDNCAGYHMAGSGDIEIYNCYFANNYDRNASDNTHWGQHAIFFDGGSVDVHDNVFEQTTGRGAGIFYKHAALGASDHFYVYRNIIRNCTGVGLGSGTQNTWFHHNIICNGAGISSQDFGGTTHQDNQLFEYNTLYDATLYISPSSSYHTADFPNSPTNITWRNNIIFERGTTYNGDYATVNIGPYMSDSAYDQILSQLHFSNNCYYNPGASPRFGIASNNSPSFGVKGGLYNLAGWQGLGYDLNSIVANPQFADTSGGDFHVAAASPCSTMGAYGGGQSIAITIEAPSLMRSPASSLPVAFAMTAEGLAPFICQWMKCDESRSICVVDISGRRVLKIANVKTDAAVQRNLKGGLYFAIKQ